MIYIIIPVYNRKQFTRDCLVSLREQTVREHHVVVVNDGSTDGTHEMLATEFPEVTEIVTEGNLFWTAAINIGIRHALARGAEYVMTLNNDTVATPDFMENMLKWSQRKPDALLGALDINAVAEKPYYGGEVISKTWNTTRFLLDELDEKHRVGLHEVSIFPGRGLLLPRKLIDTIGLFDEKEFPHYMADYDYTALARRNGFEIYCNYDARLLTYPDESGDHKLRKNKTIANYYNHLFGIKGGGNLKNFTRYTLRNSPAPMIPLHLIKGYMQRIFGYFIH